MCQRCTNTAAAKKASSAAFLLGWALPGVLSVQFGALQEKSGWAGASPHENNGHDRRRDGTNGAA